MLWAQLLMLCRQWHPPYALSHLRCCFTQISYLSEEVCCFYVIIFLLLKVTNRQHKPMYFHRFNLGFLVLLYEKFWTAGYFHYHVVFLLELMFILEILYFVSVQISRIKILKLRKNETAISCLLLLFFF